MKRKVWGILFIVISFFYNSQLFSAENKDSIPAGISLDNTRFLDNLDSLLSLWYVQQSLSNDTFQNNFAFLEDTVDLDVIEDIPDSVYIARLEQIPSAINLSFNRIVRNYINVYTRKRKDNVEVMLGLSQYYFPVFEEILDKHDLPLDLKYLPIIESALNPRARSRVGATGLWQFMYGTGRMYKLTINSYIDERRDPVKSSEAAALFLKDLYTIYNDWTLVIAAYNCGPGNVNKAIRRAGGKRNYWDIFYYLPRETRGYVPAFVAASYAMNFYKYHNLNPKPIDLPIPSDTIIVRQNIHLQQIANVLDIPFDKLQDMNPQYRRDVIPGSGMPCILRIPAEKSMQYIDLQDSIYAYRRAQYFDANVVNPTSYKTSSYEAAPPKGKTKIYYRIKSGDNLGFIASWFHVRVSDLRYWNNIRRNLIRSGQRLVVFVPDKKADYYKTFDKMSFAEKQKTIGKDVNVSAQVDPDDGTGEYIYYTVQNGDTLWDIAKKYDGVTDTDILRLNNLSNARNIKPGQKLKIKRTK